MASVRPVSPSRVTPATAPAAPAATTRSTPPPAATPPPPPTPAPVTSPGGQAVTVVQGGNPLLTADGVRVRDGVVQKNPGPVMSQDYWRDSQGHIHDAIDHRAGDPSISYSGCGSTTAAVLLARYGQFSSEAAVDDHLRVPGQLGGSLEAAVDYFQMRGLEAHLYAGGSWNDLYNAVRQGFGVEITLTNDSSLHTISVTGMFTGQDGKQYIQLMDVDGGGTRVMSKDDFMQAWSQLQLLGSGGINTGISNTYTLVGPKGSQLPSGGSLWGELNAASSLTVLDGFNAVANSMRYFGEGEVAGGAARLLDGVIECGVQAPAAIVQYAGASLEWLAGKAVDWAMQAIHDPKASLWTKILASLSLIFTFPLRLLGTGLRYVGQVVGGLTAQLARLLSWPFSKLADFLHKDNDAANAVRYANPNGTSREQALWTRLRTTPIAPGKTYLVNAMLSGHVSNDERQMILRVLQSCCDAAGRIQPAQLQQLLSAVGEQRLKTTFAGTPEQTQLAALMSQAAPALTPASAPRPIARAATSHPGPSLAAPSASGVRIGGASAA